MVRLQVLVVIALVVISNIEGRPYRRVFANPWTRALDEFRRNAACNIDLGLVMDNTKGDFSLIKTFVKQLVSKFQISDDGTRVGAITFGERADIRLLFNDLKGSENNLQNVKKQIDSWREGPLVADKDTSISEALRVAKDFLFPSARSSEQVKKVLVLFTNGKQDEARLGSPDSKAKGLESKYKGIRIFAVGIEIPDPVELLKIAGGKFKNVNWLESPDKVESIATKIVQSACSQD